MNRSLQPELLDELPAADPRAIHSRRDLRRINGLMGNAQILTNFVGIDGRRFKQSSPLTLVELGAGDGNIATQVARGLNKRGISGRLLLVDQQPLDSPKSPWPVESLSADVFAWLKKGEVADVIVCNLFLHHFDENALREMFGRISQQCRCFAACEPRRSPFALWFARKLWLIGCNDVTQHDADISVRAGFNNLDLTELWPRDAGWKITERRAGLFTHFFGATRLP